MDNKSELMGSMNGAVSHLKQAADRATSMWEDKEEMMAPHRAHELVALAKEAGSLIKKVRAVADGFEEIAKVREAQLTEEGS